MTRSTSASRPPSGPTPDEAARRKASILDELDFMARGGHLRPARKPNADDDAGRSDDDAGQADRDDDTDE